MKHFILTFTYCVVIGTSQLLAQTQLRPQFITQNYAMNQLIRLTEQQKALMEAGIDSYLHKGWRPGAVFLQRGDSVKAFTASALRYNVRKERVEIGESPRSEFAIGYYNDLILKKFELYNPSTKTTHYFVRCNILKLPDHSKGFVEILYRGKQINLYKKTVTLLKKIDKQRIGNDGDETIAVKRYHYYWEKDGKIIRLRKSKRFILRQMGGKASQVKAFVKKNKLRYRRDRDLVLILKYYDAL